MTKTQFSILILVLVLGFVIVAMAQTYSAVSYGPIAPAVANCPPGAPTTMTLCPVGTSPANYALYVSWAGGAYQPLIPQPIGVASVNGKTGALTITVQ